MAASSSTSSLPAPSVVVQATSEDDDAQLGPSLALSPSLKLAASTSAAGACAIFPVPTPTTGEDVVLAAVSSWALPGSAASPSYAFHGEDVVVATTSDGGVSVVQVASGEVVWQVRHVRVGGGAVAFAGACVFQDGKGQALVLTFGTCSSAASSEVLPVWLVWRLDELMLHAAGAPAVMLPVRVVWDEQDGDEGVACALEVELPADTSAAQRVEFVRGEDVLVAVDVCVAVCVRSWARAVAGDAAAVAGAPDAWTLVFGWTGWDHAGGTPVVGVCRHGDELRVAALPAVNWPGDLATKSCSTSAVSARANGVTAACALRSGVDSVPWTLCVSRFQLLVSEEGGSVAVSAQPVGTGVAVPFADAEWDLNSGTGPVALARSAGGASATAVCVVPWVGVAACSVSLQGPQRTQITKRS